jgi:glycosyltransferase involved in cell wall biosynthesis
MGESVCPTMHASTNAQPWSPGRTPVAVVMITLNEGHNMEAVLENLAGWAQQVFVVDSFSKDGTVDIALRHGVHVVQRRFRGFGDQWNFALTDLPITAPWTMKLDPDERLSDSLKANLDAAIRRGDAAGLTLNRRLWFMGQRLPMEQTILRLWPTGTCKFTDVSVNEYPVVQGPVTHVSGEMMHLDSPDMEHWIDKQNRYTTAEAWVRYAGLAFADTPRFFGTPLQRQMWLKKNFFRLPLRYCLLFLYYWLVKGTWRAGYAGRAWARSRADVMRSIEYKFMEMRLTGRGPARRPQGAGEPDARVPQYP